tara:strand:+ start:1337 stop:1654 length:318 start_codon:yes stop_codon:yes gene_type:complete
VSAWRAIGRDFETYAEAIGHGKAYLAEPDTTITWFKVFSVAPGCKPVEFSRYDAGVPPNTERDGWYFEDSIRDSFSAQTNRARWDKMADVAIRFYERMGGTLHNI